MTAGLKELQEYFEKSTACQEALQPLKKDIEIELILDQETVCSVRQNDNRFIVSSGAAKKKDVCFHLTHEAVSRLCQTNPNDIAEIAVQLLKEVKSRQVKISVNSNLFALLRNGYLEIIAKGGKPMWQYLSRHGITNPKNIIAIFKSLVK